MSPSAPNSADMDQKKSITRFFVLLMLCSVLNGVWEERIDSVMRLPLTPHRLVMLWQYNRPALLATAALIVLGLLTVIAFFRMIASLAKRERAPVRKSSLKAPEVKTRPRRQEPEEDAIHCEHLTGKQKYLQQIDGYLKTGLIDRNEYRVLKERYMSINIPDDYH